jgi:hypothetical protein
MALTTVAVCVGLLGCSQGSQKPSALQALGGDHGLAATETAPGETSSATVIPSASASPSASSTQPVVSATPSPVAPPAAAAPASRAPVQASRPAAAAPAPPAGSADGWGSPAQVETFDGTALTASHWYIYDSPDARAYPREASRSVVSGGQLRLTGGVDSAGRDVSGGVASTFNQLYGRWEATFRVDRGNGYSAVVLLWPRSENWPTDGEIDAVEVWDGGRQSGGVNIHNGSANNVVGGGISADFTQWHTIAVEWLPQRITVLLDGTPRYTLNRPSSGFDPIPSTSPMHLALQLDKGCVATLPCRDASTPQWVTMYVDQVRIWTAPPALLG